MSDAREQNMGGNHLLPSEGGDSKPVTSPDNLLSTLESAFAKHPGFMRHEFGFEVLHANWPAYPLGHGLRFAIAVLADYPAQTRFFPIDNIDQCTLFVVGEVPNKDKYDDRLLHVAVWDEDLVELSQMRLLAGISVTWSAAEESARDFFLDYHPDSVTLTDLGHEIALFLELTQQAQSKLIDDLMPMILARKYDSAVRDAAVGLESRMKAILGTKSIGHRLVEECFGNDGDARLAKLSNADRLEVRSMFRRFFKYVRNEVAHNQVAFDLLSAAKMLNKVSILHHILDYLG
jgi:hypothetical protein